MDKLEYRECSVGFLSFTVILFSLVSAVAGVAVAVLLCLDEAALTPGIKLAVAAGYILIIIIPCIWGIIDAILSFRKRIIVSMTGVALLSGNKEILCIPCQCLTAFGCAFFVHKAEYIFFALHLWKKLQHLSERIMQQQSGFLAARG